MKRCPITYEEITESEQYSLRGLRLLAPKLTHLDRLPFNAFELRAEAAARVGKMSIQGVQPKLSARLKIHDGKFEIVDQYGQYILKPQSDYYKELPENEALTMTLAALIGIEAPVHGLVYSEDNSMTYFIKRFDRQSRKGKLALEDFAQLSKMSRETKYNSSMEKVAQVIMDYCSFPKLELLKLFKLILFNYVVGNEDMHLKNFSLITRDKIISLAPAYDLLNTTIAQENSKEEIALPLGGKKNNLRKSDFIHFARNVLQLNDKVINRILVEINQTMPQWQDLITKSFMSKPMQDKYLKLLVQRYTKIA